MDRKFLIGLGAGCFIGVCLDRWVLPRVLPKPVAAVVPAVPEKKPEEAYYGWGVYGKPPAPPEYHPPKPPAGLTEIGRRRKPGAETPSGEALGGF